MDKMSIKLESGRTAVIHAFHLRSTYYGMIIGDPSQAINEIICSTVSYPREWGVMTHLFRADNSYAMPEVLKPYIVSAWLDVEPTSTSGKSYDGSSIVITWFSENIEMKNIKQIVKEELNYFSWQNYNNRFTLQ